MSAVVYGIFKQVLRLCWRLLPRYIAMTLGGWTLFQVQQGASWLWLVIPIVLIAATVWQLQRP